MCMNLCCVAFKNRSKTPSILFINIYNSQTTRIPNQRGFPPLYAEHSSRSPNMKRLLFLLLGFSLATAVHAQTFTITELFGFSCPNGLCPDGSRPTTLIQASDGNFYGIDNQTVYKITAAGQVTVLYTFQQDPKSGLYDQGYGPFALVEGSDGFLYGLNGYGGPDPSSAGTLYNHLRLTNREVSPCPRPSALALPSSPLPYSSCRPLSPSDSRYPTNPFAKPISSVSAMTEPIPIFLAPTSSTCPLPNPAPIFL